MGKDKITINIDFDGTCTTHEFPLIGKEIGAIPVLKRLTMDGHKLILFTMRSGKTLDAAVKWFKDNEIPLYGIQSNPTQKRWTDSPKSYAELMIDDSALGCPLLFNPFYAKKSFVDWVQVETMLEQIGVLTPIYKEENGNETIA